ncbi:MAG: transposase [Pyrinomonadaceae bacterium]|nr:transposase [Pyrinomonadaceae bacterium]
MKEVKAGSTPNAEMKSRRQFDDVFKRDAVALWVNSGRSAGRVAGDLGIEERHLYLWKKTHSPRTLVPGQVESEVAALRRENALLRQRCDILKKKLGILSESPSNASSGSMR